LETLSLRRGLGSAPHIGAGVVKVTGLLLTNTSAHRRAGYGHLSTAVLGCVWFRSPVATNHEAEAVRRGANLQPNQSEGHDPMMAMAGGQAQLIHVKEAEKPYRTVTPRS
jgi:hypothetical protein